MKDKRFVWVLVVDYGYEGLQEPFNAFVSEEAANMAREFMMSNPSATSMKVIKTELHGSFPTTPTAGG